MSRPHLATPPAVSRHRTAPPPAPLPPGARPVPGYEILAPLTRTGWLDVYDAWSDERDCRCLLKTLRADRRHEPRLRERLLREGRWLQAFSHPHLVRAYETVETPEPFVVLETLTGETVSHLIGRLRRRLAAHDVAFLGLHLCSALHYLHGRDLLHLDVKPSNVIIDCRRAKLLDLSVARPPGPAPAGIGTPCYLAPEQARGAGLSAAADVWGVGITLYEVATGDLPFPEITATTTDGEPPGGAAPSASTSPGGTYGRRRRYPQLEGRAAPVGTLRRLPGALATAVDACLEPDPTARPDIGSLAAAFDALLPSHRRDVEPEASGSGLAQSFGEDITYERYAPYGAFSGVDAR
ncbi:serine/threonine-protein kinase [Streptomyces sp. NBC_00582]|uniref:serine/threonine-protein kinase n=1 Tax=Streptomyces sp. NBC_00582 TaxID=2975783 RepID=UPI002E803699|nr:serine/threonine-protein kinase [Streptomyces sp. NBC_00582]WUB66977.1 serine/threonine protein kinase [Streptomyces sp. NBC_00582]